MNRKRSAKVIISLLILFPAYLKQDIAMAAGQMVMSDVKADAAVLKQEQAAVLIESVRINPFLSF